MFRFTIRDVLWLTVVVGAITGWCVEHSALRQQAEQWEAERERLSNQVSVLERQKLNTPSVYQEQLQRAWWHYGPGGRSGFSPEVDWSVLSAEYDRHP